MKVIIQPPRHEGTKEIKIFNHLGDLVARYLSSYK